MKAQLRCFYCNRVMLMRRRRSVRMQPLTCVTKDHVIPKSHPLFPGDAGNTVKACSRCNNARGNAPALLFYLFAHDELQIEPRGAVDEVARRYRTWLRMGCRAGRLKIAA